MVTADMKQWCSNVFSNLQLLALKNKYHIKHKSHVVQGIIKSSVSQYETDQQCFIL